jgi:hypothetical protein
VLPDAIHFLANSTRQLLGLGVFWIWAKTGPVRNNTQKPAADCLYPQAAVCAVIARKRYFFIFFD